MPDGIFSETERLSLRRLRDADVEGIYALRADPDVTRYQSWQEFSMEDARQMVDEMRVAAPGRVGKWYQFAIERKEDGVLLGDCALKRLADGPHTAEIGYTIGRPHQRQGYGREAIGALVDFAFHDLQLHRVIAVTDTRNDASIGLLSALGFRREAHFIEAFDDGGTWTDEYLFAVLAREWRQQR